MKTSNSNSKDNMSMSTQELIKELKEAEKVLFDLRFKKLLANHLNLMKSKLLKKKWRY